MKLLLSSLLAVIVLLPAQAFSENPNLLFTIDGDSQVVRNSALGKKRVPINFNTKALTSGAFQIEVKGKTYGGSLNHGTAHTTRSGDIADIRSSFGILQQGGKRHGNFILSTAKDEILP